MTASLIIMGVMVAVAAFAVLLLPGKSMGEALNISGRQALRVLPMVVPAAFIAGFLAELLPRDLVAGLLGPGSGWTGFLLAAVAGAVLPTGPMVILPLGAALLQADAGLAQVLALYAAWTLVNLQRFFIWEIPLVGVSLATRRYMGGLVAIPFAMAAAVLIEALLAA